VELEDDELFESFDEEESFDSLFDPESDELDSDDEDDPPPFFLP
jgi:hypothetical protein